MARLAPVLITSSTAPLIIENLPTSALKARPTNSRTHSKKQVRQIADSIEAFGFTNPIIIDDTQSILAGHGRLRAATLLGLSTVPCVRISTMTEAQKRAYVIADNKLALNAGWDDDLLAEELRGLVTDDVNFDIGLTGFSMPEIDYLIDRNASQDQGDTNDDVLPARVEARCRPGDIWLLGRHRLICGNALERATVASLMNGERAQMVFTDPPYNVPIDGHVGGLGAVRHREFAMASGEMSSMQFEAFLRVAFQNLAAFSVGGSIHFVCMDWRHIAEVRGAAENLFEFKNLIVWAKDNGGMGTFYRSRHELIFAFKSGSAPHINNFELGQHGRYRSNVWQYRGVNTFSTERDAELALHPTVKPVAMIADAIRDVSHRNAIVLDLFGGSGSTLIAAEKTGRRAYLCELDAVYCDRIITRYEAFAHDEAVLVRRNDETPATEAAHIDAPAEIGRSTPEPTRPRSRRRGRASS